MTTSALPRILLLDSIKLAKTELNQLNQVAQVISNSSGNRDEFIQDLQTKYAGIQGIYRHFKASESIKITGRFDEQLVSRLPDSLKFICHNGAGYDQIDITSCSKRKIQVSNVPTAVDDATADTAMFLLIGAIRGFSQALTHAREGTFNSQLPLTHDPKGKILGILGMGGIGGALAQRALPFGMKVQYHNRNRLSLGKEKECGGATYVKDMDTLLQTSDIVSLHLPLTTSTRHLISDVQFDMMKDTAILVNTSRGPIVDEEALIRALKENKIAGCGLDVYENEPTIPKELLDHPNALCLPHVGTVTLETQQEMEAVCLRNAMQGLKTGKLGFTVPEQRGIEF